MRNNQNTSGMPGTNTPEWLHKQHFSNTSLVARETDGFSPVWQAQDVPWLLKSERHYLSIGEERGCQAPELLWAVRSARKNDAIANKFTWPSSASGGRAQECVPVPCPPGGRRKWLIDHFKDFLSTVLGWRSVLVPFCSTSGWSSPDGRFPLCRGNSWMDLVSWPSPTRTSMRQNCEQDYEAVVSQWPRYIKGTTNTRICAFVYVHCKIS